MNEFIRFGSEEACSLMTYVGASQWHSATCVGGYKSADAYYQAGLVFWGGVVLLLAMTFVLLRKSITHAFA